MVKQSPWTLSEARTKKGHRLYAGGSFNLRAMAVVAYIVNVKSIANMLYY